ncbi:hypothetical protein H9P43_006603 [Blastocladiella emersonii ATCC 22665]|nr:hypothetical protein H9P43_006603 [Blastocladiella emersonii ATCC 22665]
MLGGLLLVFVIDAGIQLATWAFSAPLQTEHFYDLSGALTYTACFATALLDRPAAESLADLHPRQLAAAALSLVWCSRLGLFLFRRVRRAGHDHRFDDIKTSPVRFLFAFTAQTAWVWFTGLAVYIVATNPASRMPDLNALDAVGAAVWVAGFAIETIADHQKNTFKNANPSKFITSGLWAYSRHPNYFGEVTLWYGMFLLCASGFVDAWNWVAVLSPVFVTLLLYFGSGVRLLENSADKRYGHLKEYQEYKARTSIFFPLPPRAAKKDE